MLFLHTCPFALPLASLTRWKRSAMHFRVRATIICDCWPQRCEGRCCASAVVTTRLFVYMGRHRCLAANIPDVRLKSKPHPARPGRPPFLSVEDPRSRYSSFSAPLTSFKSGRAPKMRLRLHMAQVALAVVTGFSHHLRSRPIKIRSKFISYIARLHT